MKYLLSIILLSFICCKSMAQDKKSTHPRTFKMDTVTLKEYFFVMLTKGPKRDEIKDTVVINKLQKGHMDNMSRLAKEGKLIVAGPFGDDSNWRGIFIFDCETQQEVEQLLSTDPMIKAGRLGYEVHPWWTGMNCVFK